MSQPTTPPTELTAGMLHDLPETMYREHAGINFSTLKAIAQSPLHYQHQLTAKHTPTASMRLGTAVHSIVLTPDTFDLDVAVAPSVNRRTKAGKEEIAEFERVNANKVVITKDEFDTAQYIADSVAKCPHASNVLAAAPKREQMALWNWGEDEAGALCKGKIDAHGEGLLVDLKTSADVNLNTVRHRLSSFHYDAQMAFYSAGLKACGNPIQQVIMVFVENTAPYGVTVVEVSQEWIELATRRCELWLKKVLDCTMEDKWDRGPGGIVLMEPPAWMKPS